MMTTNSISSTIFGSYLRSGLLILLLLSGCATSDQLGTLKSASVAKVEAQVVSSYVHVAKGMPALLHEPAMASPKGSIGILIMHPSADFMQRPLWAEQLAMRGYRVLTTNSPYNHVGMTSDYDWDDLILHVGKAVTRLRAMPGIEKVVLWGNSGGGVMMSAYQNIAANGVVACQGPEKIVKCSDRLADLPAADGLILFDPMFGYGVATLLNLDPAIVDENDAQRIDPELYMFNPANGFKPDGSTKYSAEFKRRYFLAQKQRMDKLIAQAQYRLEKIEAGQGRYADDEPFVVPGAAFLSLKLPSADKSLWSGTRNAHPLLRSDGSMVTQRIESVRVISPAASSATAKLLRDQGGSGLMTTVRRFLSTFATRTTDDYGYDENSFTGIDWTSSYNSLPGNLEGISAPTLIIGMTGFFLVPGIETAYEHTGSADKTLLFLEGANHHGEPCTPCETTPGEFANTVEVSFNYIDSWLSQPKRF